LEGMLNPTGRVEAELKKNLVISCYSKGALLTMQLLIFEESEHIIKKGLALDAKHEKLRYRETLLAHKRGNFVQTKDLLAKFIEEFPENKPARVLLSKNSRALKMSEKKKKIFAKKMFGSETKDQQDSKKKGSSIE